MKNSNYEVAKLFRYDVYDTMALKKALLLQLDVVRRIWRTFASMVYLLCTKGKTLHTCARSVVVSMAVRCGH